MPLRRFIFNTLTVVSLLLMLATVVLWVRNYWVVDRFAFVVIEDGEVTGYGGVWLSGYERLRRRRTYRSPSLQAGTA